MQELGVFGQGFIGRRITGANRPDLDPLTALEARLQQVAQRLELLVELRSVESGQERVLRLDRTAARRVGVEDEVVH